MADSGIAAIAELGDVLGIDLLNPLPSDWMIVNPSDGAPIIVPDTVPKFEFRGEARVSDYPVEQGAFASYNKVRQPFDIRMVMVCSGLNYAQSAINAIGLNLGSKYMERADFLTTLDYMMETTDLFTIVTPDKAYANVNMEHFDYKRESRNGATMLIVEAWFREIRLTASATYSDSGQVNSESASAANPVSLGAVHAGDRIDVSFPDQRGIQ